MRSDPSAGRADRRNGGGATAPSKTGSIPVSPTTEEPPAGPSGPAGGFRLPGTTPSRSRRTLGTDLARSAVPPHRNRAVPPRVALARWPPPRDHLRLRRRSQNRVALWGGRARNRERNRRSSRGRRRGRRALLIVVVPAGALLVAGQHCNGFSDCPGQTPEASWPATRPLASWRRLCAAPCSWASVVQRGVKEIRGRALKDLVSQRTASRRAAVSPGQHAPSARTPQRSQEVTRA